MKKQKSDNLNAKRQ